MENDLISRSALYEQVAEYEEQARNRYFDTPPESDYRQVCMAALAEITSVKHMICDVPAVDAVPVVHGRWLYVDGKGIHAEYECDNCREHVCFDEKIDGSIPAYERCPHCGAYMRGTDNG